MSARGPSIAPRTALAPSPAGTIGASSPDSASSPGAVTSIVTSREWVLPPRPKPGRKPSVDTPASKRKAQNRAAQRAFRERRATRVQELEQQLLEVEKENEIKEMSLVNTINKLKFENSILSKSVEQLRSDFNAFRSSMGASSVSGSAASPTKSSHAATSQQKSTSSLNSTSSLPLNTHSESYKSELSQSAQHLLNFAKSSPTNHTTVSPASSSYSIQQISPAPSADSPGTTATQSNSRYKRQPSLSIAEVCDSSRSRLPSHNSADVHDFDCGVCLKDQCLCADVGLKSPNTLEDTFSTFSPMPAVSLRGKRKTSNQEVDFTAKFTSKKMPDLKRLRKNNKSEKMMQVDPFNEDSPLENCGFCSDDTPCVCREAANEAARIKELSQQQDQHMEDERNSKMEEAGPTPLPPIQVQHPSTLRKASLPVMHPGPTFELREISNMSQSSVPSQELPQASSITQSLGRDDDDKSGCTGNPGTCFQCQTDPMSTLFCSTVASKAAQQNGESASSSVTSTNRGSENSNSPQDMSANMRSTSLSGSTNPSTPHPPTPGASSNGIFIPCADAYRTLSRHKRFNTIDFSSLVGRLTTRGMQVEVQSVANMIRELDKKVYD